MEQKEINLFPENPHEGKPVMDNTPRFFTPMSIEQKSPRKLTDQEVAQFDTDGIGSFTEIDLSDIKTPTIETPKKNEVPGNIFYFYEGDIVLAKGYLSGTVTGDYLSGTKRISSKTNKPVKIDGRLSYVSTDEFQLWWDGRRRQYAKGEVFTADSRTTHNKPPKGK